MTKSFLSAAAAVLFLAAASMPSLAQTTGGGTGAPAPPPPATTIQPGTRTYNAPGAPSAAPVTPKTQGGGTSISPTHPSVDGPNGTRTCPAGVTNCSP